MVLVVPDTTPSLEAHLSRLAGPHAHYEIPTLTGPQEARFWAKVDRSGGPDSCWPWTAMKLAKGYGGFFHGGALTGAHRISKFLELGDLPIGKLVRHVCNNPSCVNPAHLEVGTQLENMQDRKEAGTHASTLKTMCPQGHPYDEQNTIIDGRGHRQCRACRKARSKPYDPEKDRDRQREYMRAYRARRKAKGNE